MRTSRLILIGEIVLCLTTYQTLTPQNSNLSIPESAIFDDPNLNPDWDWRIGDYPENIYPYAQYKIYHMSDDGNIVAIPISAPTGQDNAWSGILDNLKDDGWILLERDFGTPTRQVSGLGAQRPPHFVLYNKYRSLLRFFICVQSPDPWNKGFVELQFKDPTNTAKTPAVLAHLKPVAEAIDRLQTMKDNVSSVFSDVVRKNFWLWADFPLSYDPTITPKSDIDPPSFYFRVYGQNLEDISLKGISTGVSGDANFVNNFLTGAVDGNGPLGIPNLKMPNLNFKLPDIRLGSSNSKASGTSTDWNSFTNFFNNIKLTIPKVDISNPFKGLFDGFADKVSSFTKALPISLPGLDIKGLFDFFVNGGVKEQPPAQPAPTYIAMNLELEGTITSTYPLHEIRVTIPRTRDEYWKPTLGTAVGIVNNDPVGILTLTKTPVIYKKDFYIGWMIGQFRYETRLMKEYELADPPQLSLNQNSGLELNNLEVSIVAPSPASDVINWVTKKAENLSDQKHLIDFESPIDGGSAFMRSMPVPLQYSKGRNLQLPIGVLDSDVKLKLKATLKRKDDPNSQPVAFIATYNTEVIVRNDLPTQQILPTIPPQNVICNILSNGAAISWDRNLEKNIKYYVIERSINNSSYIQIGITSDTMYTDSEVKKAVKPYEAGRKNVQVYYRVRARSEWIEPPAWYGDNEKAYGQFSAYSNIANVYGSIQALFDKRDASPIVPETDYLSQNFPNPFNPTTTIYYSVREEGIVTLRIYNSLGQEVALLLNERKEVGYHYVEWDASQFPSGIYYYRISHGTFTETKRMVLTK